jgi:3-oxoacyl-[acyl-carrier-protein] synthase-3
MTHSRMTGTGGYLPAKVLTNRDLEAMVDTSDEWIVARTGIRERHIAADGEYTSDLALHAARRALEAAGRSPDDVDLIVVATSTPDMVFPSSACLLQAKLGVKRGAAFDVQAVCSGFVYALATADLFIKSGAHRCALVVGAEVFSRILDWGDRATCVLFGDGAGAVVLEASPEPGILSSHLHADGSYAQILNTPGHVCRGAIQGDPTLKMDGGAVFKLAVRVLEESAHEALDANGLQVRDLDAYIAHQANVRILSHVAKKLGLPEAKSIVTVDRHANTSAASVPLALDVAVRDGRVKPGHLVLMQGVGGGFTWGSVLARF